MIQSIHIRNFRNIRSADIDLERLTVFVGANAVGKSSVLEAVQHCILASKNGPKEYFVDELHCDWLYTRGGRRELRLHCNADYGTFGFSADVLGANPINFEPPEVFGTGQWTFSALNDTGYDMMRRVYDHVCSPRESMVFLKLDPSKLAQESYSDAVTPIIEPDGTGLPSVLAFLKLTDDHAFTRIQEALRELVPQIRRIGIRRLPIRKEETEIIRVDEQALPRRTVRNYPGEALFFDFCNAENIPARAVSEGTLLLLGLLTLLHGKNQPNVILMDDIERGLHPLAQRKLLSVLSCLMDCYPKLQVLATSHSPYLLDGLRPEQVRCMTTDPEGYAVVNKLGDHPEFAKWQDEMAPGEMWSMFGEKWMPAAEPHAARMAGVS